MTAPSFYSMFTAPSAASPYTSIMPQMSSPFPQTPGIPMPVGGGTTAPAPTSGGGLDWSQIIGALIGAGAGIYGANNQNQTNNQNYQAQLAALALQQQRQAQISGLVTPMIQQGQSPYASALMQMLNSAHAAPQRGGTAQPGQTGQPPQGQPYDPNLPPPDSRPSIPTNPGVRTNDLSIGQGLGTGVRRSMGDLSTMGGSGMPLIAPGQPADANPTNPVSPSLPGSSVIPGVPATPSSANGTQSMIGQQGFTSPTDILASLYSAQGYKPSTYGAAQIGGVGQVNPMMVTGAQVNPSQVPLLGASQITAPTASAGSSQGFNSGQDALLQMMRSSLGIAQDQGLTQSLQNAGQQFDNTDLMSKLNTADQGVLNQQVAQLQGSVGSLGQRFGTANISREAQMRSDFANQEAARNAQLTSTSFENAQNRNVQSLGLQTQREGTFAQLPLQQAQLQLSAAQAAQQGGLQGAQLQTQNNQFNAGNQLTAQQLNNQFGLQAGTQNQNTTLQTLLANLGSINQGNLANQGANLTGQQTNANNQLQALLANMSSLNSAGQFNSGAQNTAGQFNAGAQNTAGQFNAGQTASTAQFNTNQDTNWNQLMSSILGQANGMQTGQQNSNAQLLSILAGLQAPGAAQQQPSAMPGAITDISQLMMMLPFLQKQS